MILIKNTHTHKEMECSAQDLHKAHIKKKNTHTHTKKKILTNQTQVTGKPTCWSDR
jgi:hypothetical protein